MTEEAAADLVLDYHLDASPQTVWRAVNTPEIRRRWLPDEVLADPAPVETIPGREVRYRMREPLPPYTESIVRFQLSPDDRGGTRLRILHDLIRPRRGRRAVNGNVSQIRMAA